MLCDMVGINFGPHRRVFFRVVENLRNLSSPDNNENNILKNSLSLSSSGGKSFNNGHRISIDTNVGISPSPSNHLNSHTARAASASALNRMKKSLTPPNVINNNNSNVFKSQDTTTNNNNDNSNSNNSSNSYNANSISALTNPGDHRINSSHNSYNSNNANGDELSVCTELEESGEFRRLVV